MIRDGLPRVFINSAMNNFILTDKLSWYYSKHSDQLNSIRNGIQLKIFCDSRFLCRFGCFSSYGFIDQCIHLNNYVPRDDTAYRPPNNGFPFRLVVRFRTCMNHDFSFQILDTSAMIGVDDRHKRVVFCETISPGHTCGVWGGICSTTGGHR